MGAGAVRLIVQPLTDRFELCARLGLVLTSWVRQGGFDGCKIVHAVLDGSPSAHAGIEPRDVIVSFNGVPWDSVRHLAFSDKRHSEITAVIFVARYFTVATILLRVPPEPYRSLDRIATEAADVIAAQPTPDTTPYRNPRLDEQREFLATLSRGLRRR
jgi:membrane-associated protease RseP (regulator of RpoE activity)